MSYLLRLATSVKEMYYCVHLNKLCREDLYMWVLFLENWNGVSLFYEKNFTTSHDIYLHTDAASTAGFAVVYGSRWMFSSWPLDMPGVPRDVWKNLMAFIELYPIVAAAFVFGHEWRKKKTKSRYLDDLLNIDNNFFDSMVNRIYPSELQLNKANVSDAEASFLDLHLSISDGFVKTKIYDKRDDFDFDIVNFPFLDGDVPRSASYGVYISQLIRFARVSSHVDDFNTRNKVLTAKLLRQGYRYHKLRKAFSKFYRRHFDIVSKYNVGLKTLLLQGLSEPEFYGDLVYKFRKIIGKIDFPYHFKKIIVRYKKIGYNINVMRQTACLVVNPIKVNSFAYLFNCTTVGRTSD